MLKESIKALAKDSFFYGIAGSVSKFFILITIPLLARVLSKDQLGIYDVVTSVAAAFVAFAVLGQDSAIARFYYDSQDSTQRRKVVSLGLYIQVAFIILLSLIFLIWADDIAALLFGNQKEYLLFFKLSLLAVPGQALILFSQNLFKYNFIRVPYLLITIGSALVFAILLVIFMYYTSYGLQGAILASVLSMNAFAVWGLWMNRKYLTLNFKKQDLSIVRSLLRYGLPFTGVMAVSMLIPVADRFFLVRYATNPLIAEYAIASKVAYLLAMFVTSFSIASGPYIFSVWHKKEAAGVFSKLLHFYLAIAAYLALGIFAFRSFIISVMGGGNYPGAEKYLPLLLVAGILEGLFVFSLVGILWSKKAIYNFYVYIIGFGIIFLLNYFLVPLYLVQGAILSIVLAKVIMNIVAFIISNKFYKIDVEIYFILKTVLLCTAMGLVIFYNFWFGLASLVLFPILGFYFLLSRNEAGAIKNYFRKKRVIK